MLHIPSRASSLVLCLGKALDSLTSFQFWETGFHMVRLVHTHKSFLSICRHPFRVRWHETICASRLETLGEIITCIFFEVDFAWCRKSGPAFGPHKDLLPLFSMTNINDCFRDIMYPNLFNVDSLLTPEQEAELIPWEERKQILFWRGTTTGKQAYRKTLVNILRLVQQNTSRFSHIECTPL